MTITMAGVKTGLKLCGAKLGNAALQGATTAGAMVLATYTLSLIEEKRQERKERKHKAEKKEKNDRMAELRAELAKMEKEATAT